MRRIAALLGAVALSTAVLSGCSGESSPESNTAGTSSGQESEDSKKSAPDGLPEGFPDDVPLPEFTSVTELGGESGGMSSVLLELKNPTDTPVEDYAAQLIAAGYTVPQASVAANAGNAKGPKWEILFLSAAENMLTVSAMSNQ